MLSLKHAKQPKTENQPLHSQAAGGRERERRLSGECTTVTMFSATARRTQLESWTERMVLNRGCTWNPQGTGGTYANAKSHTPQFNQNFQSGAGTLVVVFCCVRSAPQVTKCSQAVNRRRHQVQVFDCSHHLVNSQQRPRGNPESTGSSFRRLTGKAKGCRSSCHATKRKEESLRYPIETYALHDINK